MKVGIAELLSAAVSKKAKKDRIAALQKAKAENPHVFSMLKYMFKPNILFQLPEGEPPYKPQPKESDLQHMLYSEFRRIKIFMRGEYPQMTKAKREMLFIEFLEMVDADDAKLLIAMKDKTSPYKNLTKALVMEAFPEETVGW